MDTGNRAAIKRSRDQPVLSCRRRVAPALLPAIPWQIAGPQGLTERARLPLLRCAVERLCANSGKVSASDALSGST